MRLHLEDVIMRKVLRLKMTLSEPLPEPEGIDSGITVRDIDLDAETVDYEAVLEAVFWADSVQCW